MKWSMQLSWNVHSVCPFERTEQRDTVLAASESEAMSVWMIDYGHGSSPVVKYPDNQAVVWSPEENPDFGGFLTGYKLISIKQTLMRFDNTSVTTWVRRAVRREHNPNRDASWQEAAVLVPREVAERFGAEAIAMKMMANDQSWQKDAAMSGQTYITQVDAETVRVTLAWYLDLS